MSFLGCSITAEDEEDFYRVLEVSGVDHARFENHWPYIIQATRNAGFVYKEGMTRVYSYMRDNELVVVNCFGRNCAEVIANHAISNQIPVSVKNISIMELPLWEAYGFKEKESRWSEYSVRDDNSYPECVYELEVLAQAHLPVLPERQRTCRASHANRLRKFIREREIYVKAYESNLHQKAVLQLLYSNAVFLENKGVESMQNVIDAHLFVFDENLQHQIRLVHIENEEVIGFNYLTCVNNTIFGNAIIHRNETDLMRFLVWQGFNHLYHSLDNSRQYFVTMQGSEHAGQYHWKRGFAPAREIEKTHLYFIPPFEKHRYLHIASSLK
jgi:hypothetical protein